MGIWGYCLRPVDSQQPQTPRNKGKIIIIIIIIIVVVIELTHSKTILENTVEIEP